MRRNSNHIRSFPVISFEPTFDPCSPPFTNLVMNHFLELKKFERLRDLRKIECYSIATNKFLNLSRLTIFFKNGVWHRMPTDFCPKSLLIVKFLDRSSCLDLSISLSSLLLLAENERRTLRLVLIFKTFPINNFLTFYCVILLSNINKT